jgi:copper chaperone CopZ
MIPSVAGAAVESYLPGRIRVRLSREQRRENVLEDIELLLGNVEGIRDVTINAKTGSVLVEYDPDALDLNQLIALGQAANIITDVSDLTASQMEGNTWPGPSEASKEILAAFRRLDRNVSRLTRGTVDAKTLVPLALLTVSLGRAFLSERRVAAPWYSLMWYAYSMFMHWHNPTRGGNVPV